MNRIRLSILIPAIFGLIVPSVSFANSTKKIAEAPPAVQPTPETSNPALAAKAPGAPGYGMQITTARGKIMMTNLRYDPADKRISFNLYRIDGPAGWGPYRCGIRFTYHPAENIPAQTPFGYEFYGDHYTIEEVVKGSAAEKAGLEKDKYGLRTIVSVDGDNFGWDAGAMAYYITNHPTVEVKTMKFGLVFSAHPSYNTYKIKNQMLQTPADPADGTFESLSPKMLDETIKTWMGDDRTFADLLKLRSKQPRYTPLAFDLDGKKLWAVSSGGVPSDKEAPPRFIEFWKEDPSNGNFKTGLLDSWFVPSDGMTTGRILRVGESWYQVKNYVEDPATHRLMRFELDPWNDVEPIFNGKDPAEAMGPVDLPGVRESLENAANDLLVEWKTRTLPGLLAKEPATALEERVIHLEKSLLSLDREVRHIREDMDAATRTKADMQAQAQLPGAQPVPGYDPVKLNAYISGQEHVADALAQRQAILQAILGSIKQALAQVRR